jgi:hypothetical protein
VAPGAEDQGRLPLSSLHASATSQPAPAQHCLLYVSVHIMYTCISSPRSSALSRDSCEPVISSQRDNASKGCREPRAAGCKVNVVLARRVSVSSVLRDFRVTIASCRRGGTATRVASVLRTPRHIPFEPLLYLLYPHGQGAVQYPGDTVLYIPGHARGGIPQRGYGPVSGILSEATALTAQPQRRGERGACLCLVACVHLSLWDWHWPRPLRARNLTASCAALPFSILL